MLLVCVPEGFTALRHEPVLFNSFQLMCWARSQLSKAPCEDASIARNAPGRGGRCGNTFEQTPVPERRHACSIAFRPEADV